MSDMGHPDPVPLEIPPLVRKEPVTGPPMLPCPECGQQYKGANGLGVHRSTMHGIVGPTGSKVKKRKVKPHPQSTIGSVPRPIKPAKPDWSTREVFDSVVSLLWPGDAMPVAALPILLDWKDDTERMLHRLEALP